MQNRHDRDRNYGRPGDRPSDDNVTWQGHDRSRDEGRSWASDPNRDFRRTEGYGQYSRDDRNGYGRDRWSRDPYDYGSPSYEANRASGSGRWNADREADRFSQAPRSGEFGQDYGYNRAYGRDTGSHPPRGYGSHTDRQDHGYAPGSQIWEGQGRESKQRDFEPDYLHWREQQMSNFDRDYDDWRSERRQKFSSDFDTWRSTRGNPIVENVSDGGTGSQKDVKNS